MAFIDDDRPKKQISHEIGQDLAVLSVGEIDARIRLLRAEIERLQADRAAKEASRSAADAVFRR